MKALLAIILFGLLAACTESPQTVASQWCSMAGWPEGHPRYVDCIQRRVANADFAPWQRAVAFCLWIPARPDKMESCTRDAVQQDMRMAGIRSARDAEDISVGLGNLGGALKSVGQQRPPTSCITTGVLTNCY